MLLHAVAFTFLVLSKLKKKKILLQSILNFGPQGLETIDPGA
jgi:hypothetical protein